MAWGSFGKRGRAPKLYIEYALMEVAKYAPDGGVDYKTETVVWEGYDLGIVENMQQLVAVIQSEGPDVPDGTGRDEDGNWLVQDRDGMVVLDAAFTVDDENYRLTGRELALAQADATKDLWSAHVTVTVKFVKPWDPTAEALGRWSGVPVE